jgi:putative SOS response-associated peptidase YedK
MPVILRVHDLEAWLDPGMEQKEVLALLAPYPDDLMEAYPVSSMVNSSRNNSPECVARLNII